MYQVRVCHFTNRHDSLQFSTCLLKQLKSNDVFVLYCRDSGGVSTSVLRLRGLGSEF